jgi:hypothetical protein
MKEKKFIIAVGGKMITETQIQNFLYEIDEPLVIKEQGKRSRIMFTTDDCALSDDQINSLAKKIFNNQKILFSLFDKVSDKPCVCGFWGIDNGAR